jgi:hypothetical protein
VVKYIVPASSYSVNSIDFEKDIQNGNIYFFNFLIIWMLYSLIQLLDNLVNMRHQPIQRRNVV